MKRPMPFGDQVDISSDESSPSDTEDDRSTVKQSNNDLTIIRPAKDIISEDALLRRAAMYQEFMKQIPLPKQRGSVIPFTSWTGLAKSMKQLYGQPLHYLTNIRIKQWDQMREAANEEDSPLDTVMHPCKAETSIWLIEEVHRLTSSHQFLAKLWLSDPMYYTSIDSIFPQL